MFRAAQPTIPFRGYIRNWGLLRTNQRLITSYANLGPRRPSATRKPLAVLPHASLATRPPLQPNKRDKEAERRAGERLLERRPEEVTTTSSVRKLVEPSQAPPVEEPDISAGLRHDLHMVKDTFALSSVPFEAYALGLAGTLPYWATSFFTLFLSWNLDHPIPTDSALLNHVLFDHDTALFWLQTLEPIQVGYGAVLISFLGAIHWGLELAEKRRAPGRTPQRYIIGVSAPLFACSTIFMPLEWALISQFFAFCFMYSFDFRATVRGWVPPWYATYRFVLTGVVGSAIVLSLIFRAKIGQAHERTAVVPLKNRIQGKPSEESQHHDWEKEEKQEMLRVKEERERKQQEREALAQESGERREHNGPSKESEVQH